MFILVAALMLWQAFAFLTAAVWLVLNLGESRCYRNQLESKLGLDEESKDEMKYGYSPATYRETKINKNMDLN